MVVLFAAGNALQVYAIDRTRGAVRALARLAPNEVLVKRGGTEVVVPAGEVGVGDTVVGRPGERLAVDGRVIEGSSAVDEAPVTGESVPVEKGPGDECVLGLPERPGWAASRGDQGVGDSTLQRIARLVEEAQASKAPAEQFVDRFSRVYTPVVVAVAIVLAVVPPLLGGGFSEWFYRALALLIIACPCALVISTPVTVVSGIGAASRRGILVKGGAALEAGEAQGLGLRQDWNTHRGAPDRLAHRGSERQGRGGGSGAGGLAGASLGAPAGPRYPDGRGRVRAAPGLRLQVDRGQGSRGGGGWQAVPDRQPPAVRREGDSPRQGGPGA